MRHKRAARDFGSRGGRSERSAQSNSNPAAPAIAQRTWAFIIPPPSSRLTFPAIGRVSSHSTRHPPSDRSTTVTAIARPLGSTTAAGNVNDLRSRRGSQPGICLCDSTSTIVIRSSEASIKQIMVRHLSDVLSLGSRSLPGRCVSPARRSVPLLRRAVSCPERHNRVI
jgi:hypothetical protein